MRILIVEDDKDIGEFLLKGLHYKNSFCDLASNGKDGLKAVMNNNYDIAIIDLVMPDMDGSTLVKKIRDNGLDIPIVILTALQNVGKKSELFKLGVDDYVTKPFSFDELFARILSIQRRKKKTSPTEYLKVDDLEIIPEKQMASRAGKPIKLRRKEYVLLEYLMRHKNKVISRDDLMKDVWGYNMSLISNTIDSHISSLRRKIDNGFKKKLLHTIHRAGYMLGNRK